jgi:diguanylate cyclase (GGDEF)-like protein
LPGGAFRLSDLIFRFGGEEFLVVLPEAHLEDAAKRTDALRQIIEEQVFHYEDQILQITISAGVAEMHASDLSPDQSLKRADTALYLAKGRGRNRVEAADEPA